MELGEDSICSDLGEAPPGSQAGFTNLRVPNLFMPTSLTDEPMEGEEEEDSAEQPASAACGRVLFPVTSLSKGAGRSISLFPLRPPDGLLEPEASSSIAAEKPAQMQALALSELADCRTACSPACGRQSDDPMEPGSPGSLAPTLAILTQDQIPRQQAAVHMGANPCEVQRVDTRTTSKAAAAEGQASAGGSGRADSPAYEADFDEEDASPHCAAVAGSTTTSRSPSRMGRYAGESVFAPSRPASAPESAPRRPRPKPSLEDRMAAQMARHPSTWGVTAVCDWLEYIGLGQYRQRFVHHCVTGELLLRLSPEQLKVDLGIGPLGHREGLLRAVSDLTDHYSQPGSGGSGYGLEDADEEDSNTGSRSPGPPTGRAVDFGVMRAYEQRQRLVKDLHKAEAREAHRRRLTEDATRTLELATEEVRKLKAVIADLDKSMGWSNVQLESLDMTGALPWHPVGQGSRPATSPASQPSSPQMSRVSRRIMEGQSATFLDRLQTDIANRQAKLAYQRSPGLPCIAGGVAAEREREARDIKYIRDMVVGKSSELHDLLGSGSAAQVEEGLDDVAEMYQADFSLDDEQVAAVKRTRGMAAKASKLANFIRSVQFMDRYHHDLASRDSRLKELHKQWQVLEGGRNPAQQEEHDLAQAKAMFGLLGWPEDDLDVKAGDSTSAADDHLGGLLNRVWALRRAAEQKKEPDWRLFRKDGLNDMQEKKCVELQAALDDQKRQQEQREAERAAAARAGKKQSLVRANPAPPELPAVKNYLQETVQLLARCRHDEIEMLERLGGYRKLVMVFRAVRAMKFVEFTRADLEQRKQKAEQLAKKVYPANRKVLPKEEFDKFFDRLQADTNRRLQNKAEIAEKARQEALAKLTSSAPAARRRPQSARL